MIKSKDIIQDGHKTLRKQAQDVVFPLSDDDKKTATEILKYLKNSQDDEIAEKYGLRSGVGLAAPQINKSIKMFGIYIQLEDECFEEIFINPKIISHSEAMVYLDSKEGCLSVDEDITGFVPRYKMVRIEYMTVKGEKKQVKLTDYLAIVFQHEFDHLNGILFTDKVKTVMELNKMNVQPFG